MGEHLDVSGEVLRAGDAVQFVMAAGLGTNAERAVGLVVDVVHDQPSHVWVTPVLWWDIDGVIHPLSAAKTLKAAVSLLFRLATNTTPEQILADSQATLPGPERLETLSRIDAAAAAMWSHRPRPR